MLRLLLISILVITSSASAVQAQEPVTKLPMLVFDVSGRLINAAVARDVDRVEPVEEVIQETPVRGMGRTRGKVAAELLPDATEGFIDVVFRGQIDSQTVGLRPHTRIHTITTTPFEVRRRVIFDGHGIRSTPGGQASHASSQLLAVTGKNGDPDAVGTDIVRTGFYRSKADAEAESAYKAAARVSERMAEELASPLEKIRKSVGAGLERMKKGGLLVESLRFNTTPYHLQANLFIKTPEGRAPSYVPAAPGDADVGIRVHQSLVNEAARLAYGGRSFTVNKVSGFYQEVTMDLLRDGRKEKDRQDALKTMEKLLATLAGKPVTINLAANDPITVTFVDNGFSLDVHIDSVRFDDVLYAGGRVRANYHFENRDGEVHLVRKEPVQVKIFEKPAPGQKKFDVAPEAIRQVQDLFLSELLKERLIVNEIPLADVLPNIRLATPRVGARDGWFGLAWSLK